MATQPERVILTYEDYAELPADRNRYELIEGELQVTTAPNTAHQRALKNLAYLIEGHVRAHRLGLVLFAPCDVLLSDITVVQPDLLFVAREREAIVEHRYVRGAPDLVVEVLSPTTARTDRETKRQLYARYAVPNYWLIDPQNRAATAYVLESGTYRRLAYARGDQPFAAPPFPDLTIPLTELWA